MSAPIDQFQTLLTRYFRDLVLATAYLEIGHRTILQSPPQASVTLTLAPDLTTEPMSLQELLPHSSSVSLGTAELFQTKSMAAWSDLLNTLFEHFVELHMGGKRLFPEIKKRGTRLDFSSAVEPLLQVRQGLVADFAFGKYVDRIQTISRILVPDHHVDQELRTIRKHVAIRNATQHHAGTVYEDMLKDLGSASIEVFDRDGRPLTLTVGQSIALYVPELDRLKSSLFVVTNHWRAQLA